ncbi:retrovirus-related pol polyprotein from transposon TNT 1-94 [Tanacetum coccineum]
MSNSNTNLQTQSSNALHNAIMEAGGKDRPPMLALVLVVEGSSETTTEGYIENYKNVSQDIRDQLNAEAEAGQIILTGIDNDIYFTVDACPNACEMWKSIERFYKMMNELVRNQCDVTNHQVNVQFLLQLQPEWQRFMTLVKQSQELKTVSYHKLYDILKQHQNEVNEIRAERLARTANPLALVAQQQPIYNPQNHPTQNNQYSNTRSQQSTRNRGKEVVNSSAPIYDQEPARVTDDDEMLKEKEIDKLMALISLSFKIIYKPTNNNLQTSSNTSRGNQDNSPRINKGTRYDNQRVINVVGARDNVVKDAAYHKEKMLLCKQEEAGVQLNAEQVDWKDDTDDEFDDQELEARYMYMAQIQEVTPDAAENSGPIFDAESLHKLVEIILFIVDYGCSKHMTGNLKLLTNFVEKFLGMVNFGNDQIAPILSYGDLVQGTITIKRVYYVEGLNHNLFSIGQFCDADLEVAFRKSTCYIRVLKGNDLLTGSHGTYLYSITLQDTTSPNPICLMAKATSSQAWLWHRRLSHLNFDTINLLSKNNIVTGLPKLKFVKDHLCSSCELGKAKRKSFHTKTTPSSKRRLQLLHMDLCGPMRVESINGKKYVLVIVDDYSRYTWTHFLRSKDETPAVLIDFLTLVQRGLHAQVRTVRTDKGTKFLNKTLHAYFAKEGIRHETSTARTPKQNGVVERRNRTLVEAARTMLSAAKVPLFFWAEAIATACFTQNRSLVIPRHEKTPYHIINARKPSVKFFHIFGSLCYIVRDGENLDKMKEKESLSPDPQSQENVPQVAETVTTSNELKLLYSPIFNELLNGSTPVVSKSSAIHTADAPDKRQHQNITHSSTTTVVVAETPLNIHTTPQTTNQAPTQVPTVTSPENIIQAETNTEYA